MVKQEERVMKFLKQPCDQCPFRLDRAAALSERRAKEIDDALRRDRSFACHKDVQRLHRQAYLAQVEYEERLGGLEGEDREDEEDEGGWNEDLVQQAAFCGGALHYMQSQDLIRANRLTRVALMLGLLKEPLDPPRVPMATSIDHLCNLGVKEKTS
jgi:hypothetical protein